MPTLATDRAPACPCCGSRRGQELFRGWGAPGRSCWVVRCEACHAEHGVAFRADEGEPLGRLWRGARTVARAVAAGLFVALAVVAGAVVMAVMAALAAVPAVALLSAARWLWGRL
jgi:hypothetical protein